MLVWDMSILHSIVLNVTGLNIVCTTGQMDALQNVSDMNGAITYHKKNIGV